MTITTDDLDRIRGALVRAPHSFVTAEQLARASRLDLDLTRAALAELVAAREVAPVPDPGGRLFTSWPRGA